MFRLSDACASTPPPGWSFTYSFDARGNRLTTSFPFAANKVHTYDQANRLRSYTQGSTTIASYSYDGDNLRTSKTVNGATTNFTWDETAGLPMLLVDGAERYIYGPLGEPIERITATTATYLHQDHLGSTRLLTDATGSTVGTYTYSPYGATQAHTGTASVNLGYAGQYTDTETGYQYLRNRYYDPTTTQFLTIDPLVTQTGETYGYGTDSPIIHSDPSGLDDTLGALCASQGQMPSSSGRGCQDAATTGNSGASPWQATAPTHVSPPGCHKSYDLEDPPTNASATIDVTGAPRPRSTLGSGGGGEVSVLDVLDGVTRGGGCLLGGAAGAEVGGLTGLYLGGPFAEVTAVIGALSGALIGCIGGAIDGQPGGNPP